MFYRSFLVSKDCEFRFYATLLSVPKYQRNGHCPALHQQKYWPQIRAWPGGIQYLRDINNYAKTTPKTTTPCLIVYIKFMAKNVSKTWYPSIQLWIYHQEISPSFLHPNWLPSRQLPPLKYWLSPQWLMLKNGNVLVDLNITHNSPCSHLASWIIP
jgi:hypothetical protein